MENASAIFYKSSGSVTSAMRAVVFALNGALAERNLILPPESIPVSAQLSLGVIHHDVLFLAQAGLSQALLVKTGSRAFFYDSDLDPRGLGLTQVPRMRFFQQAVDEGDIILFSTQFPIAFLGGSSGAAQPELSVLLKELDACRPLAAEVGLARVRAGEGTAHWLDAAPAADISEAPAEQETETVPTAELIETDPAAVEETTPEETPIVEAPSADAEAAPAEPESFEPLEKTQESAPEENEAAAQPEPAAETQPVETAESAEDQPALIPNNLRWKAQWPTSAGHPALQRADPGESPARPRRRKSRAPKQRSQANYRKVADSARSMNKLGEGLAAFLTGEKKQSAKAGQRARRSRAERSC
jgi:hypothetical protein